MFIRAFFQMIIDFLKLCRVSNLPTVWTNVLAAAVLSTAKISVTDVAIPALSMSLFYSAGMCMNDIADRFTDRLSKPSRPIPAGRISPNNASIFTVLLVLSGFLVLSLFTSHAAAILLALALLILIICYNLLHKKHSGSVILMAGCRFMIFAVTAAALRGEVGDLVLLAGACQFVYAIGVTTAARWEKGKISAISFPVIPLLIAGFSIVDGLLMGIASSPAWFPVGLAGFSLTILAQHFVRGD